MPIIKIQWIFNGIDHAGIDVDKQVWRLPFNTGPNWYGPKLITPKLHCGKLYYRIFDKRYSKDKLNQLSIRLKKPKEYNTPENNPL